MSRPSRKSVKLEEEPLWILANDLVEHVYALLPQLPEDEKWDTVSKLRTSAVNLLFYVSQAVGSGGPATMEYEWGDVRKHLAALKTLYRFAGRQHYLEIDPHIMMKFEEAMKIVDQELQQSYEATEKSTQDELEVWRDRYRLWKEKTEDMS